MGQIVHRKSGPDYRQDRIPTNLTVGNLWFSNQGGNLAMSNGNDYGGAYERVGVAGYVCGGYSGSALTTIEKLLYLSESISTNSSTLTSARYRQTTARSLSAGYNMGGYLDSIEKMIFSTEDTSPITSTLTISRGESSGVSSSTSGYAACSPGGTTTIDKLDFVSENVSSLTSGLPSARKDGPASFMAEDKGYWCGGATSGNTTVNTIYDLDFSDDTTGTVSSTLPVAVELCPGVSADNAGYILGGRNASVTQISTIQRLIFSNESTSSLSSTISSSREGASNMSSYVKGYAAGGYGGGSTSAISALSYSSESTGDITSSLVSAKYDASGFENLNSPAYG